MKMTESVRDHLERAVAWLDDIVGDITPDTDRIGVARAEIEDVLELLDAIPPREATEEMIAAGVRASHRNWGTVLIADLWRTMYDAAIAEKEGK